MRAAQMYEEEQELAGGEADLHLGMGSLIGIFFGLALVCGVFFGFGYMMGHHAPGVYVSAEPLYESPKPSTSAVAPKPSAQVSAQPSDAARVVLPSSTPPAVGKPPVAAIQENAPPAPATPASTLAPQPKPVVAKPATAAPTQSAPASAQPAIVPPAAIQSATGTVMVQIAAVKNRSDAEALAAALQKNGFNATVRTEAQDKFFHVQVGPFANRDDAKAMRQKLANAGYNAFIK